MSDEFQTIAAAIMTKHFDGFYSDVRADIAAALREVDRKAREECAWIAVLSARARNVVARRISDAITKSIRS